MSNRQKYTEKLFKLERLRRKNFRKSIARKKVLFGRKLNEKKEKEISQEQFKLNHERNIEKS